jgi:hypothetical protein
MYKVTLEINSSIYAHIMFFLENLPKNLVNIKEEIKIKKLDSIHTHSSISKFKNLQGVGKELYQDVDSDTYIKELRNEW